MLLRLIFSISLHSLCIFGFPTLQSATQLGERKDLAANDPTLPELEMLFDDRRDDEDLLLPLDMEWKSINQQNDLDDIFNTDDKDYDVKPSDDPVGSDATCSKELQGSGDSDQPSMLPCFDNILESSSVETEHPISLTSGRVMRRRTIVHEPTQVRLSKENDLEDRYQLRKLTSAQDKLNLLLRIYELKKDDLRPLSSAANDFFYTTLSPIINCFYHHFQGDQTLFLERYGDNFRPSLFGKQCCLGRQKQGCSIVSDNNPSGKQDDLKERHDLHNIKDSRLKMQRMIEIHQSLSKRFHMLTRAAQNFVYIYLNPIMHCLNVHHGGNLDAFLSNLNGQELHITTFKDTHCCGTGQKCNTVKPESLDNLPKRFELKSTYNPRERIKILREIYESCNGSTTGLTGPAKSFVFKQMNPVLDCLDNHFKGNVNAFLKKHGDFRHSRFQRYSCCGKGAKCQVTKT